MKKLFIIPFIVIMVTMSFATPTSYAATGNSGNEGMTYTLLEPLPCIPTYKTTIGADGNVKQEDVNKCAEKGAQNGGIATITKVDLGTFFQYAFNLLIALSAVLAVFMIVWSGFQYMTTESWQGKSGALTDFRNAILGLLMVLGTFIILKTVNPKLVQIPQSIPSLDPSLVKKEDTATAFFEQLIKEADSLNISFGQAAADARRAQQTVTSLEDEQKKLKSDLGELLYADGLGEDNQQVKDLRLKIEENKSKIIKAQADTIINITKGIIQGNAVMSIIKDLNAKKIDDKLDFNVINEEVNETIKFINETRDDRNAKLQKIGAYSQMSGSGGVNDISNAAELQIRSLGIETKLNGMEIVDQGSFVRVYGTVVRDPSHGNDPVTLSKMKSDINAEISDISKSVANVQDQKLVEELQVKIASLKRLSEQKLGK